jgi:hypothetical protein
MWGLVLGILGWPWKKIVRAIMKVATWILEILPDPKPPSNKP